MVVPDTFFSPPTPPATHPPSRGKRLLRKLASGLVLVSIFGWWSNSSGLSLLPPQLTQTVTTAHQQVLGATTDLAQAIESVIFKVNVPAVFTEPATFNQGLILSGSTLESTGSAKFATIITNGMTTQTIVTRTITASNIIYGLKAGDGITVGTGQNPIITNTGVLSLGGATGSLKLVEGTGITVDGLTITNKDPGSAQNIFKTIQVAAPKPSLSPVMTRL